MAEKRKRSVLTEEELLGCLSEIARGYVPARGGQALSQPTVKDRLCAVEKLLEMRGRTEDAGESGVVILRDDV